MSETLSRSSVMKLLAEEYHALDQKERRSHQRCQYTFAKSFYDEKLEVYNIATMLGIDGEEFYAEVKRLEQAIREEEEC